MITEANYSKQSMKRLLKKKLPNGTGQIIADKCGVSVDVVRNCMYGKHYNADVIEELTLLIGGVKKNLTLAK